MFIKEFLLKNGTVLRGLAYFETEITEEALILENGELSLRVIDKNFIQSSTIIRKATIQEVDIFNRYDDSLKEKKLLANHLSSLDAEVQETGSYLLNALNEATVKLSKVDMFLTHKELMPLLTKEGVIHFYRLVHFGTITLEGSDEIICVHDVEGKQYAFKKEVLEKLSHEFNVLELNPLTQTVPINKSLCTLINGKEESDKMMESSAKDDTNRAPSPLNLKDIQSKLSELGFQNLSELEKDGIISIDKDGNLDISTLKSIPFIGDQLANVETLCKILNMPSPNIQSNSAILPFVFGTMNDLSKIYGGNKLNFQDLIKMFK